MRVLANHDRIVVATIEDYNGHVIKRMGDGLLAEFSSAVSSVECALRIQQRLAEFNALRPENERFLVRIGVHLGDIMVVGDDILGDGVNVASRIEPLAAPGGICISQDIFNQVHNKVEMQTVSLGPQQLKNIARQIEIFRVLADAAADLGVPGRGLIRRRWALIGGVGGLVVAAVVAGVAWWLQHKPPVPVSSPVTAAVPMPSEPVPPPVKHTERTQEQAEKQVIKRSMELLDVLFRGSEEEKPLRALVRFVADEDQSRLGQFGVGERLKGLLDPDRVHRFEADQFRIASVDVDMDAKTAVANPEVLVRDRWVPAREIHWTHVDDGWFLALEALAKPLVNREFLPRQDAERKDSAPRDRPDNEGQRPQRRLPPRIPRPLP